jgi:hypothetical protein
MPCAKFSLVGDSQSKAVQDSLPPEWAKCGCVLGSWPPDLTHKPAGPRLGITIPTSLCTFFARELQQTKPKQYLRQKIYTRTAVRWPNRHDFRGSSQSHLLLLCICFAPCITGVFVYTWIISQSGQSFRTPEHLYRARCFKKRSDRPCSV